MTCIKAHRKPLKKGIKALTSADEIVAFADTVVLAVKPQFYADVIKGIKDKVTQNHLIVTIAPGQTLAKLETLFGKAVKIVRTMPNTPALVGEGMTALCRSETVSEDELKSVRALFDSFGKTETVAEYMMDAVVAVAGSSPPVSAWPSVPAICGGFLALPELTAAAVF